MIAGLNIDGKNRLQLRVRDCLQEKNFGGWQSWKEERTQLWWVSLVPSFLWGQWRSLSRAGAAGVAQGAREGPGRVLQAEASHRPYQLRKMRAIKNLLNTDKIGCQEKPQRRTGFTVLPQAPGLPRPSCPFHGELVCWRREGAGCLCHERPGRKFESGVLATRKGND